MQRRERFDESGNIVNNNADRPNVPTMKVHGEGARIVKEVTAPLTKFRIVRGKTIGGGTSREALRRARRRLAANGS